MCRLRRTDDLATVPQSVGRKRGDRECCRLHDVDGRLPLYAVEIFLVVYDDGQRLGCAQGIRDALDVLAAKGELKPEDDLKVLVLAGDGSTYDMGLSATSGAIHRGLDFWYLCYDNEAYGNTGFQTSSGSPLGSQTATATTGTKRRKKNIFEIWCSQHPAYVATVCSHEPADLAEKIERAKPLKGPKLFLSLATCPTGWGFAPELSDDIARLAIETGVWPLKEAVNGDVRHTLIPNKLKPVEEYLRPQRRFRNLFKPQRQEETLRQIQQNIDEYWNQVSE